MKNEIDNKYSGYITPHYRDINLRNTLPHLIANDVNNIIPSYPSTHSENDILTLKTNGYIKFDNFLTQEQVEQLKSTLVSNYGYNTHVPRLDNPENDGILRKFSPDYEFNTLCYTPDVLVNNSIILNKAVDSYILSLAQAYLGCFPTIFSFNAWWHLFKNNVYGTQVNHRDYDDFKFLALFIYLTDVDETTGPHVFHPGTQDGSDSIGEHIITGKAGTAILADTFALHRGQPLQQGSRLVCWWRYGLTVNARYNEEGTSQFIIPKENIFSNIPNTLHNEYLFRAFY